eukprot:3379858-Amphidinium_carterae.1
MPGIVTILYHAECLGAWTSFWGPCRGTLTSPLASKVMVRLQRRSVWDDEFRYYFDPVSRRDVCSWRWHASQRNCMEAVIEHLGWLLYSKFAHKTFTIAAFRVLRRRVFGTGMSLESSHALLKFSWLVGT